MSASSSASTAKGVTIKDAVEEKETDQYLIDEANDAANEEEFREHIADMIKNYQRSHQEDDEEEEEEDVPFTKEEFDQHLPFIHLSTEAQELYLERDIPRIPPPTSLEFYRDYISKNRPVIITGALSSWPAMKLWNEPEYLRQKLQEKEVTIDRVPLSANGNAYGDSVVNGKYFVTPHEEKMKFGTFLDCIEADHRLRMTDPDDEPPSVAAATSSSSSSAASPSSSSYTAATDGVLYCQHQNNSLNDEFTPIVGDVKEFPFVSDAFGAPPEAVNIWVGTSRSISTLHHDPYENIYSVITGTKHFQLYPPTDYHWLDKREYPKCKWVYEGENSTPNTNASSSDADVAAAPSSSASTSTTSTSHSRFSLLPDPEGQQTAWFDLESPSESDEIILMREMSLQKEAAAAVAAATAADTSSSSSTSAAPASLPITAPSIPLMSSHLRLSSTSSLPSLPPVGPSPSYETDAPINPRLRQTYASPIHVELRAGEVLYLPALWFHRVAQTSDPVLGRAVAVNAWYDMAYDSRYAMFRFVEQMSNQSRETRRAAAQQSEEQEQKDQQQSATTQTTASEKALSD